MILVVAEQRGGKLNRATWETIAAAQELCRLGSPDPAITIVVLGSNVGAVASDVAAARVQNVVVVDHPALDAVHARRIHGGARAGRSPACRRRTCCCRIRTRRATSRRRSPRGSTGRS